MTLTLTREEAQQVLDAKGKHMSELRAGYTGWFNWPAVYCQIKEIKDGWLYVVLEDGQHGVIREADFTPQYRHGAGQEAAYDI